MGKKWQRFLSLPVISVISFMIIIHYSVIFIFLERWLGLRSAGGFFNALVFSYFAFMCFCSFGASVLIDPGQVPAAFTPDLEGSGGKVVRLKFCEKCNNYKPPRAHHCRVCKKCILRMDHHCLWISNCVGYSNYKPFVTFVLYATISSIYAAVVFIGSSLQDDRRSTGRVSLKLLSVAFGSTVIILSILLGTLLGWHLFLMCHNMTTIEYREGIRAMWLARKSGQCYRHPFDLGPCRNFYSILGPNALKWGWPLALGHLRDGLQFPSSKE